MSTPTSIVFVADGPHSQTVADAYPPSIPAKTIFGLRFNNLTLNETIDVIERMIAEKIPRQISFSNAQTLYLCWRHPDLRTVINQSYLNLADGMSIVWGSHILNQPLPQRVAGPDCMSALLSRAQDKNYRVFFMGTSAENLNRLKGVCLTTWPNLKIAGMHSPSICEKFSESENVDILDVVHKAQPDILFVGVSCPKQEKWIAENLGRLGVPVSLAVGAGFDFLSGKIPRAPDWLRKRGLEWMFRLWCEPRRLWKRYLLGNSFFLILLIRERIRMRFRFDSST